MKHNKFSKETLWAVSIILICIAAGYFLFFKTSEHPSVASSINDLSFPTKTQTLESDTGNATSLETNVQNTNSTDRKSQNTETPDINTIETKNLNTEANDSLDTDFALPYDCPIDFASLWEINEDVYAWITIPGTVIDYPILQHETDNSYYLNYTLDGIEGYPGSIYTENVNAKDFTDNNTVIYGHNMRNGTMFTDLHKFRDAAFFEEHDTISIYTPEKQLTYKIFAAYLYDDRHLTNSFDFSDVQIYTDYLSEIQNIASETGNIRDEIKITERDKIITLITCIREQPEKRVYVQAVLQQSEP